MSSIRNAVLPLVILLSLLFGACGAYFNTYYNAKQAYDEGVRTLDRSGERSARNSFDKCLRVSSKLLQFYPESRWVDNTILLIGQCYVHMDQHHRALRKFDELEARFPDSELLNEARIWRARSLLALERDDACLSELGRLKGQKLSRQLQVELNRVYEELYRGENDLGRLIDTQQRLLEVARKRSDKARINVNIARTYEELGDWEKALKHFGNSRRYPSSHDLLLESWLGSLDNMLRLGRLETAERRLRKLEKDERFFERRHTLQLRRAWLAEARGNPQEAISLWRTILEDFRSTESSSAAAYGLGRRFLLIDMEPDSAEVYYKRAKQEKGSSIWADSSQAALDLLGHLRDTRNSISELDGALSRLTWELIPDSARTYRAQNLLESLRPALLDSLDRADTLGVATADSSIVDGPAEDPASIEPDRRPKGNSRRSKLFDFKRKEREAMRADSLRRVQVEDSLAQVVESRRLARLDSLWIESILDTLSQPAIDSNRVAAEMDSLQRQLLEERFTFAELQARKLGRPEQADSLLLLLLKDPAASDEQAARLHYAYGRLRLVQFEDSSGYRWLERLIEQYPLALAANPARSLLGLPPAVTSEDSAAVLLEEAQAKWLDGSELEAVLEAYQTCAERYPESRAAYTAWIAMGVIALEDLENPTLAEEQFREAMRRFPDGEANDQLRQRLGLASLDLEEEEEELPDQQVSLSQVRQDDEGRFVDPELELSVEQRLAALRERFATVGRVAVDRTLE